MKKYNNEELEEKVIDKLKTINDLELPINIYDLGLIYNIDMENIAGNIEVSIKMTVINSRCNSRKSFTDLIIEEVQSIEEVHKCNVKFVFSPKWELKMISEDGLKLLRESKS